MAGRPGLYQELAKYDLLREAWGVTRAPWPAPDKAVWIEMMLVEAGSYFRVSPRAVRILMARFEEEGQPSEMSPRPERKKRKPNSGSFKPGNPGGPGAPLGNENAVKWGEFRDPRIHAPEDVEFWVDHYGRGISCEGQRHIIEMYDQRLRRLTPMPGSLRARLQHLQAEQRRLEQRLAYALDAIALTEQRREKAVAKLRDMERAQADTGNPEDGDT